MSQSYVEKSKRSHFESFANKIFTGIKEINPEYAEKRAIWELFQNALDLTKSDGELHIKKTHDGFQFTHNGEPFKDDNLGALVKQYSNGKTYGSNGEQVGQYGTGFLSTHVYGKEIILNGCVQGSDNRFRSLNKFKIDRTLPTPELLTDALMLQDDEVASLCDGNEFLIEEPIRETSFQYVAKEANINSIDNMFAYVKTILPYVFCFNNKLSFVKVCDGNDEIEYKRISCENGKLVLHVNQNPLTIEFLEKVDENIKIIFPQSNFEFSSIPKQFLFYPLIETIDIGVNFLVHAQEFKPNKERDFLHKIEINDDVKKDVTTNRDLLVKIYDLIINKIKDDDLLDFHQITNIVFVANDVDFEKELKAKYINEVKQLNRVQVGEEMNKITQITFFDHEILLKEKEFVYNLYSVLSDFRTLPKYETFIWLSHKVCNWIEEGIADLNVIDLKEVCKIISIDSHNTFDNIKSKESFTSIINAISTNVELLKEIPLIPNIHHQLTSFDKLRRWDIIENSIIEVFDNLCPTETEKYLHPDFYFITTISTYTRDNFKDDFSKFCNVELDSFIKEAFNYSSKTFVKLEMIIYWLTNFIGINKSTELNRNLFDFFREVFELELQQNEILSPTVGTNFQPAFKLLSKIYTKRINSLGKEAVVSNVPQLLTLITYLDSNINLREELLDKLPCFPSQSYLLRSQSEVYIDRILDNEFKDQYFKITGNQVRDKMVLADFEGYLQHQDSISGLELGDEIETKLSPNKMFLPSHHDDDGKAKEEYSILLKTLLELIQFISRPNSQWGNWLKSIDQVKEEILMHRFKDKATRLSLFSILSENEDKINLLGRLAKIPNLEALIKAGEEKQREESRKNNHLNYINLIGILIQNLLEVQLGVELAGVVSLMKSEEDAELNTKEEQNGQDFIIYKNKTPIYYLEVKSKWDDNGRFALSKNQTEKCASEKEKYAVISVNVDRYKKKYSIDKEDIAFSDLKEFVRVNDDLGEYFEKLVLENISKVESTEPKLIEYRGSIPQKLIDETGSEFDPFVLKLIDKIKIA